MVIFFRIFKTVYLLNPFLFNITLWPLRLKTSENEWFSDISREDQVEKNKEMISIT